MVLALESARKPAQNVRVKDVKAQTVELAFRVQHAAQLQDKVAFQQEFVRVVAVARGCWAIGKQPVDIQSPQLLVEEVDDGAVDECRSIGLPACPVVGEGCPLNDPDEGGALDGDGNRRHETHIELGARARRERLDDPRLPYKNRRVEESHPATTRGGGGSPLREPQTRHTQHQYHHNP